MAVTAFAGLILPAWAGVLVGTVGVLATVLWLGTRARRIVAADRVPLAA
jgi:hypothetical protein